MGRGQGVILSLNFECLMLDEGRRRGAAMEKRVRRSEGYK